MGNGSSLTEEIVEHQPEAFTVAPSRSDWFLAVVLVIACLGLGFIGGVTFCERIQNLMGSIVNVR